MENTNVRISIFDVTGQLKKELTVGEIRDNAKINIADLEEGFYLIKISIGKEILQK